MPGGYVVRDANGQALAYTYSRETEAEARQAKMLGASLSTRKAKIDEIKAVRSPQRELVWKPFSS